MSHAAFASPESLVTVAGLDVPNAMGSILRLVEGTGVSIQEMIASLVQQKVEAAQRYDAAIASLRELQDAPEAEFPSARKQLTFEPIRIEGEPLSQTVIDGRGPY